jgi:hypothetical protein
VFRERKKNDEIRIHLGRRRRFLFSEPTEKDDKK